MKRNENWPEALWEFLTRRTPEPFDWARNNCALFTADAILAMTGTDVVPDLRAGYDDAISAALAVRNKCGGDLEKLAEQIAREQGCEEVHPNFAQRGDVVLFDTPEGPGLGVVDTTGMLVISAQPLETVHIPIDLCRRAWRI